MTIKKTYVKKVTFTECQTTSRKMVILVTYYRIAGFFRVHPFPAMFARIPKSWKMHSRKNTVSWKSGRLRLLLWFRELLIRVDLIHGFRMEFAEKTWRVNNLIYGMLYIERVFTVLILIQKYRVLIDSSIQNEPFNMYAFTLRSFHKDATEGLLWIWIWILFINTIHTVFLCRQML